jgi:glutathione S-transferase
MRGTGVDVAAPWTRHAERPGMILIGQYDSPFVRRVAISLRLSGFAYQHDTRSVFADFDAILQVNPLGRIPSLVLDDGDVMIDSAAILDWLDQSVGPERALIPAVGVQRRVVLHRMALATGVIDKAGAAAYERLIRPAAYRWPEWIERRLDQAEITTACMLRYLRIAVPDVLPAGRYPSLDALSARCESRPEFIATCPADYAVPRDG